MVAHYTQEIRSLPRSELVPWPDLNPRRHFPEAELEELRLSLEVDGMLQPVGVTLREEPPHWIFAGERRWRAAEGVLEELPVVVRQIDEETARRLALTENIQRDELTAVEEADGLERYIMASGKTQKEIAGELGKSQGWLANRLRLLRLPEAILELIQGGALSATQARDLILPFSKIDTPLWKALAGKVATKLERLTGENLTDEEVRRAVSDVAVTMSGWLDHPVWNSEDTSAGIKTHIRLKPKHWKTAPKGSLVQYRYGPHGGQHSTRCFDAEWWLHAMEKQKRRLEQAREKMHAGDDSSPDLQWSQEDGPIPPDVTIPWAQRHVLFELGTQAGDPLFPIGPLEETEDTPEGLYDREWVIHGDPTVVPLEELILYEGTEGNAYDRPQILVKTEESWQKAHDALTSEVDRLLEDRQKGQAAEDLQRAKSGRWNDSLPELIALSRVETSFGADLLGLVYELAEDLELELPSLEIPHGRRWGTDNIREAYAVYEALQEGVDGLSSIMAVLRYRLTDESAPWKPRGGLGLMTREQIRRSVNFELRTRYYRELEALELPFDVPTPAAPEEE